MKFSFSLITGTLLIFRESPGCASAALIPSNTFSSPSRLATFLNSSGSNVSRLILMASIPASSNASSCLASRIPFVVNVTFSIPGIALICFARLAQPLRTRGSPPVSLILRIPRSAAHLQMRRISSYVRISA